MKSKTDVLLEGTIIADILKLAHKGDFSGAKFVESSRKVVQDLGKLTVFEKACYAFWCSLVDEHQTLTAKLKEDDADPSKEEKLRVQFLSDALKASKAIMWLSIQRRIKRWADGETLSVQAGFKVAALEEGRDADECDCPACRFRKRLEAGEDIGPAEILTLALMGGALRAAAGRRG